MEIGTRLVCVLSCFGGIALAQAYKGSLIASLGWEKGQGKMSIVGPACMALSLVLPVALFFPFQTWLVHGLARTLLFTLGSFGGVLAGQAFKARILFTLGLERGQKKMFALGLASVAFALLASTIPSGPFLGLVCVASAFGTTLLTQSLRAILLFTKGLRKSRKTVTLAGYVLGGIALILCFVPFRFPLLAAICVIATLSGLLLAQNLKGHLIITKGLEKGQMTLSSLGKGCVGLSLLLSLGFSRLHW